jgi:uncharacterized Fe-S cluster protein YjdI
MSNKVTKSELAEYRKNKEKVREYSTNEITVFWRPELCIHSANCLMGLPAVFSNRKRPWIDINGGTAKEIAQVVDTCPSRALTYLRNSRTKNLKTKKKSKKAQKFARIHLMKDGPYMVSGNFIIRDSNKKKVRTTTEVVALCSCGHSANKPFCDSSHLKALKISE